MTGATAPPPATTRIDRTLSRTPRAAAQGAPARPACGYLHNAFGPGCPYCSGRAARSSWTDHALCGQADPEAWFPEPGIRTVAKAICARCPVRRPCLLDALARNERWGIWAGLSTSERDALRRERRAA